MNRPYGMSSLSVSQPHLEDCACPDGVSECCGKCPGCDCRGRIVQDEAEPTCTVCDPTTTLTGDSLWCRFHGLQIMAAHDLATPLERVELFLREYWPYVLTIGLAAVYMAAHLLIWARLGFRVVGA